MNSEIIAFVADNKLFTKFKVKGRTAE